MGTNYIAPIWRMPRNANKDKLSNYSLEFGPTTIDVISTNTTWQTDTGLDNAKKVSFSVWVNPNSGTGSSKMNITSQAYGTWDGNFNIAYTADTTTLSLDFRANNNAFINSSTLLAGDTWHHICFVIDLTLGGTIAQEVRCFVNNSEVVNQSSINPPLNFVLQSRSFNIGRRLRGPGAGSSNQWQGKIAQACFFNYALTDGTNGTTNQIEYLYNLNNPMAITGAKPVAYWPLGDNSNPNATAGYPNISVAADSVFNFNGSNNFIELNSVQNLTGEFSISIWVKPAAFNSNQIILGNDAFDWIRLLTANQITFRINGGSGSTDENFDAVAGESLVPNVWQHLFFYRDSSNNIRVYRNGSLFSDDINTNSDTFKIGKIGSRTGVYYTGEISNVAIWKSDQSSEISNIYNSGVPATTYTNTPTAWYKLNQSANWEADTVGDWQIPDAVSSYPQSFNFDGNDDFVSTNFNVDNYTNLTYSVWVNPTSLNQRGGLASLSSVNNFVTAFWDGSGGKFYVYIGNVLSQITGIWSGSKFGTLGQEKWLHIAVVYDGSGATDADRLKVYADGNYVAFNSLGSIPTSIPSGGGDLIIGKWNTAEYDGIMSNVMLFDTSLLATGTDSIETLYNSGVPLTTAIASDNLKAWYKLNDNEKFDGTNWSVENQKYPAGFDSALSFDGSNDFISVPNFNVFDSASALSISFWIKAANGAQADSYATPFGNDDATNFTFFQNNVSNQLVFRLKTSTTTYNLNGPTNFFNGNWRHVLATYDGSTIKFFVDGGTPLTLSATGTVANWAGSLHIGKGSTAFGNYFNGQISNVQCWNSNLSSQVETLYNNGTPLTTAFESPVSWWKLDNTTTGIQDSAGTNDGTNNGATKANTFVSTEAGTSSGMTEQNLVNNNVSVLNGESSGMNTTNLVTSNISRTQPYSNYSFNFDAAQSDYFNCGNGSAFDLNNAFSISTWVKYTSTSAMVVLSKRETTKIGLLIEIELDSGKPFTAIRDASSNIAITNTYSGTYNDGNWHNIIATFDRTANELKLYVDNELKETANTSSVGDISPITNNLMIGRRSDTSSSYFDGEISNICIFDRVINQQEVLKIYNNGVTQDLQATSSFSNNISAWWPMDEHSSYYDGTDWVIRDVENGNDGDGANTGNVDDLVGNAPGSSASGTSSNLTIADLKGNMYNSNKNAYSINMADYASGVTNPANSGRSTDTP